MMPSNNSGVEDVPVYSGAAFYMIRDGSVRRIAEIEKLGSDETQFTVHDNDLYVAGYHESSRKNIIYKISTDGIIDFISLPSEIKSDGGIDVNDKYCITADRTGTEFYVYDFSTSELKLYN